MARDAARAHGGREPDAEDARRATGGPHGEDPGRDFLPTSGRLLLFERSNVSNARYDTGVETGSTIGIGSSIIQNISILTTIYKPKLEETQKVHRFFI